jgi:hypothetical protein
MGLRYVGVIFSRGKIYGRVRVTNTRVIFASALGVVMLGALSGCGGGGGTASGVASNWQADPSGFYATNQPLQNAMVNNLNALSNSTYKAMQQQTGTATYNGYARVVMTTPTTPIELLGLATLDANFSTETISGNLTSFAGNYQNTTTTPITVKSPQVAYTGSIAVTNGCIGTANGCAATRPNQFVADFSGTLTGQGNTLGLTGGMAGDFKGSPVIQGIEAAANSGAPTLNGVNTTGSLTIAATP